MKILCRLSILFLAFNFCFAQQRAGLVVVNGSSKELKRAAHRLHIPVEQLKHARQTLQEATNLARKMDPYPTEQLFSLVQLWVQLDRTKAKETIESFIGDLRSEAAESTHMNRYQTVTSTAVSLMSRPEYESDHERMLQTIRSWPDPEIPGSEALKSFREGIEAQAARQALQQMVNSDPMKAAEWIRQSGKPDYTTAGQVVQSLFSRGNNEEAIRFVDETIGGFDSNSATAQSAQEYEMFVRQIIDRLDADRANRVLEDLVSTYSNLPSQDHCAMTVKAGSSSIDLTCAESKIVNLARSAYGRPGFAQRALDSAPGLKSKLDGIGGIDAFYGGNAGTSLEISYGKNSANPSRETSMSSAPNPTELYSRLKGKDPAYVKRKLKDKDVETLMSLAMNASYQDPDLASTVLDLVEPLIQQVEPLQKRQSIFLGYLSAHRQVEGESDPDLLKTGFLLADQIREEIRENAEASGQPVAIPMGGNLAYLGTTQADWLEAFLVADLVIDSFDLAIQYVRSMEKDGLKLQCLMQIAQVLSQNIF